MSNKRTETSPRNSVEIDPSAPGTIVRIAFAAESVVNFFILGFPMIFNAKKSLESMFLSDGQSATPQAASVFQLFGLNLLAMTAPMVLALPNKPGAIELRRLSYQMIATFEAAAVPLTIWQAWVGEEGSGFNPDKLTWGFVVPMGVLGAFRAFVLYVKPEWMGKYRVKKVD
ncbi:hypothetical protein ACJ41O_000255 [Fusarium nematophilum]